MTAPSARDGFCACGCGQETRIGHDGLPRTWRKGHQPKPRRHSLEELFWKKVEKTDTCWLWTGCLEVSGYGKAARNPAVGSTQKAHRIAYVLVVGPIPEGLELDHLCEQPSCVNPDHLEPVTGAENHRRKALRQTACANGHDYDFANTYVRANGYRQCRACHREQAAARRARKQERAS